jgi:hypothetical protein
MLFGQKHSGHGHARIPTAKADSPAATVKGAGFFN